MTAQSDQAAQLVRRSREAQGLPPRIEDGTVLARVAAVLVATGRNGTRTHPASDKAAS